MSPIAMAGYTLSTLARRALGPNTQVVGRLAPNGGNRTAPSSSTRASRKMSAMRSGKTNRTAAKKAPAKKSAGRVYKGGTRAQ